MRSLLRNSDSVERRHALLDPALLIPIFGGAVAGAVVGAIVAVNFVIVFGPESGYESSIVEVFDHSLLLGVVTVGILLLSPAIGAVLGMQRHGPKERV